MCIIVCLLTLALPNCAYLPDLRYVSFLTKIWITATDYYMYFYIIMLFPLTAILQLINFTALYLLVY